MVILPKAIHKFNAILSKFQCLSLQKWKIHMEPQKNLNSQSNCKTKSNNQPTKQPPPLHDNKAGLIILLNFRLYCKATVIKMAWYRHKQSMEQKREPWNKPHTYGQLTHDKEGKNNNKKQKRVFQQVVLVKLDSYIKRIRLKYFSHHMQK